MPSHPLTNFEIKRYYQHEPRSDGFHSRNTLSIIWYGVYVSDLNEYANHYVAIYLKNHKVTYFDSFSVEDISEEIKNIICNKNIKSKIFQDISM